MSAHEPAPSGNRSKPPVLVGYEPSDQGRDALALGELLTRALGAPLVVACVYAYEPALYVGSDEYQAMLRSDAETAVSLATSHLPPDLPAGFEAVAVASPPPARGLKPAAALHELADASSAEVLVVGSCHRGRVGRVLLGSVGERLLHGAPCPIAVAERGFRERTASLTTIGVAFDGREESEAALGRAAHLARATGAALRLISVLEPLQWLHSSLSPGYFVSWLDEGRKAMQAAQADAIDRLAGDLEVQGVIHEGAATEVLAEESGRELDLLVTGSRGYGPLGRVLLGGFQPASCAKPDARYSSLPGPGATPPPRLKLQQLRAGSGE